jgi:hypothetical protein
VTESGTKPPGHAQRPLAVGRSVRPRPRVGRAAACGWCTFGGAAGYVLHGPAMAAAGLAAAVIMAGAIVVLWSVLLSGRDPRSPFVRFMLLTCVLTGRPPRDYLLPDPGTPSRLAGHHRAEEIGAPRGKAATRPSRRV